MLSVSSGSKSVHKTPLETNLVRDDYIKDMKFITSTDYGNTRFRLLFKFEDSNLVLVSCSNGVSFAHGTIFDSV